MTARSIPAGSIILTPADARLLYQAARLGELRERNRVGNTALYELLTDIARCAFTGANAESGILPRQRSASRDAGFWTVHQVAKAAGLSERKVRLDCQTGTLPAKKTGSTWLIPSPEANTYITGRHR